MKRGKFIMLETNLRLRLTLINCLLPDLST